MPGQIVLLPGLRLRFGLVEVVQLLLPCGDLVRLLPCLIEPDEAGEGIAKVSAFHVFVFLQRFVAFQQQRLGFSKFGNTGFVGKRGICHRHRKHRAAQAAWHLASGAPVGRLGAAPQDGQTIAQEALGLVGAADDFGIQI